MEKQLLIDPMVIPEFTVIAEALGENHDLFTVLQRKIIDQNLVLEWNYYKDTKSWLCKILDKKKNLGWLSVWDTGLKLTFYFPERYINGVYGLAIDEKIIQSVKETKPVGKSHPVILLVNSNNVLEDGIKILDYKRGLK